MKQPKPEKNCHFKVKSKFTLIDENIKYSIYEKHNHNSFTAAQLYFTFSEFFICICGLWKPTYLTHVYYKNIQKSF